MAREAKTAAAKAGQAEAPKPGRQKLGPLDRAKRRALLGKKLGMSQVFSEAGEWTPVTIIQAGPCTVLQVKTEATDGYPAIQLGFDETTKPRKRPQQAYLDKIGAKGVKFVREVRF